jgi:hypothetical protein
MGVANSDSHKGAYDSKLAPASVRILSHKSSLVANRNTTPSLIAHDHASMHPDVAKNLATMPTYTVYSDNGPSATNRAWGSSKSLIVSLGNLRDARNHIYDPFASCTRSPAVFIAPTTEDYPYGNKIGPLRDDDDGNHWGYKFRQGGRDHSVWIEKKEPVDARVVAVQVTTLKEDLQTPLMAREVLAVIIR